MIEKIFLFLALVAMLFSQASLLINLCRDQHEDHFCGIIFDFGSVVQDISFEDIYYLELCQSLFWRSKTICVILVEGIKRNIFVKLFLNFGPVVQENMSFKDISHLSCDPYIKPSEIVCALLLEGIMRSTSLNLNQWFKRRFRLQIVLIWSSGGPFVGGTEPFVQVRKRAL